MNPFGLRAVALGISMCVLASSTSASGQTNEALDPGAVAILRRMADYLRNLPSFRLDVELARVDGER